MILQIQKTHLLCAILTQIPTEVFCIARSELMETRKETKKHCVFSFPISVCPPALFPIFTLIFVCRFVTCVLTLFLSCSLSDPHYMFDTLYLLLGSSVGPYIIIPMPQDTALCRVPSFGWDVKWVSWLSEVIKDPMALIVRVGVLTPVSWLNSQSDPQTITVT